MNENLLMKYLTHSCSSAELNIVEQWMKMDKTHAEYIFEAERIWNIKHELYYSNKIVLEKTFSKIKDRIEYLKPTICKESNKKLLKLFWCQMGVAVIIIVLLLMNLSKKTTTILPETVAQSWNTVYVHNGQQSSVVLSDGTKVTLNSGTVLRYPSQFNDYERIVEIKGEALFEVNHDEVLPFIVKTEKLSVKDLGTTFNLKAYPAEPVEITLTNGKVEVESKDKKNKLTMKPNDQVIYSEATGMILKKDIDTSLSTSWVKGEGIYKNMKLINICRDLERRFNVKIVIENPLLRDEVFTCHYQSGTSIIQIMKLLKYTRKLDYTLCGGHILITEPQKRKEEK